MRTLQLFLLLIFPNFSFACADFIAPYAWYIKSSNGAKTFLSVIATDGSKPTMEFFNSKNKYDSGGSAGAIGRLSLPEISDSTPAFKQKWLFGTCQIKNQEMDNIIAYVEKRENPGWSSKIHSAYKINPDKFTLEKINATSVKCYDAGLYGL
jgi:hypothetical protein